MEHERNELSFKELYDEATKVAKALVQYEIQRSKHFAWMVEIFLNSSIQYK